MSIARERLSADPLDLPARFERKHGRPLRILHLGNVANYAYVNAKLMRARGVDCDVIDPDFYHIMATPEWIEARVDGDHGDDFYPKWGQVDTHGYRRPDWFVQGPTLLAFAYLDARRSGRTMAARYLWNRMTFERQLLAKDISERTLAFWSSLDLSVRARRGVLRRGRSFIDRVVTQKLEGPSAADLLDELRDYDRNAALYRSALRHFDIVQGYTVSAIFAAVAGFQRYTAYELGTLRGLPFEDSPTGRLTAWLYLRAPEVFVTNVDCIEHAKRLGIEDSRTNPVLHAYDVDGAVEYAQKSNVRPDVDPPLIFAPARHHWKEGNASWLKGNDVLIRAAGAVARTGRDFKIIFVRWGQEVELSEALIESEGLRDRVEWVRPQARLNLWPYYLRAAAVADQYNAAAFGGVALDAMSLGKRLLTRYDASAGAAFFSTVPEISNCASVEELTAALIEVIDDPEDRAGRGARLQKWMMTEHGVERQMRTQFETYERLLANPDS